MKGFEDFQDLEEVFAKLMQEHQEIDEIIVKFKTKDKEKVKKTKSVFKNL